MGITGFQWATLILGVLAFLITWTGFAIGWGRLIEAIKADTTAKIAVAKQSISDEIDALRAHFLSEQKAQDQTFGEVGIAMRQKIADVEKEMHDIEIWGRDNYAGKDDVRDILNDIKAMRADIKSDFRDLNAKIDGKH